MIQFAARRPDMVSRLALFGTAAAGVPAEAGSFGAAQYSVPWIPPAV